MPPRTVAGAVRADLARVPPDVRESALALTALTLARTLDKGAGLSTAAVARELRALMERLMLYATVEESTVDDLAKRRVARRATVSERPASGDVSGPGGG